MALDPVRLDDLTWSEMAATIRSRIAAVSDSKWILHAPVDPGVTLLELFAWLLEQRVYWLDQVPDSLVRAAIRLLGAEAPRPAQAAATVFALSDSAETPRRFLAIPEWTELRLQGRVPPLIFSTSRAGTIFPIERITLVVQGTERTSDLEQHRTFRIFPADGNAAEVKIVLWLEEPLPQEAPPGPLSLLFDLRVPKSIAPQWSPDAVSEIPPPADLTWWYAKNANGAEGRFPRVEDGTGGLRRSGLVRLWIPANSGSQQVDWAPDGPPDLRSGAIPYAVYIRVGRATFTAPPRLESLIPNVAIGRHVRQTQEHLLMRPWLPLPGNVIALTELPEREAQNDYPPVESTVSLRLRERSDEWHEWHEIADLAFSGPGDRHFVVDRERGELRFGDGLTGRLPVLADPKDTNVKLQYVVGGGSVGIVGENLKWEAVRISDVRATNIVPTEGGTESESIASARGRVGAALKRRDRAVIREDYEHIAETTPGVAIKRAHAAIGYHPDYPCSIVPGAVTVFVVPDAPREDRDDAWIEDAFVAAPRADPGAQAAVLARFQTARLVTTEVFVRGPRYRPVALSVTVEGDPADPREMQRQIQMRLANFLDPLIGGDEQQGWPFGEPLRPSVLLREAQRPLANGEQVIAVSILLIDTDQSAQDCIDVPIGPHDLVTLHEVTVRINRRVAGSGGLR